jgi:hypothetical protein
MVLGKLHKNIWIPWKGKNDFFKTQLKMSIILLIAYLGDRYEPSYKRNDNHNMTAFWIMNGILLILSAITWTGPSSPNAGDVHSNPTPVKITFLSREQTEEWKGWMQFAFIMYHYYRAYSAYNYIRVFVSSYVWMTGFGNYLYFEKTKDFSLERIVSMVIRINYFPLLLCLFLGVPLELYYVVPLHTVGFFITMITCYMAYGLDRFGTCTPTWSRIIAITIMACLHVAFYETNLVNLLQLLFGKEISFRFQADKYSAWMGILSGFFMKRITDSLTFAYGTSSMDDTLHYGGTIWKISHISWIQRIVGFLFMLAWYFGFGYKADKYDYNTYHPYVFILALIGWLMVRNSSKYLTECHSTVLEFLGKNTLETYVLQFHLFMNHSVQYIPMILPYSDGKTGLWYTKFLNMILCGIVFVTLSVWARRLTVSTQMTVVELLQVVTKYINRSSEDLNVEVTEDDGENTDTISFLGSHPKYNPVSTQEPEGVELSNVDIKLRHGQQEEKMISSQDSTESKEHVV